MKAVVKFSLKQTVLINVVFVILVIVGVFSLMTLPVENMPKVNIGKVFISTTYYGASAEDVEKLVTKKIEDALDGMESVEFIQSRSYRNFSQVIVKFIDDTDYEDLYDELRFRTLNAKKDLPDGVDEPTFFFLDTNAWKPVIVVNIAGEIPQRSLKLYADELKASILNLPDVRNVTIAGEFEREFHVTVDPRKLRKYGITFNQVGQAIQSANTKIPTGRFRQKDNEYMLDAGKRLSSQEEVLNVIVRRDGDDNFIRVRDLVTNARLSHRDPIVIPSVNGESTLRLIVIKEDGGNAVTLSSQIKALSRDFAKKHQDDDIHIVYNKDSSIEINDSINTLGGNLILGMFLVTIILWITLGFRNAMLTAIGIPFSFLCSLVIMQLGGVTLNTISLFSFVLVTGIIVDDAIVIMENVFRHIQMGKLKRQAVIDGTAEVMLPVISAALTTILAFLPMLIMTGSTGEFFSQVPKTVTFALVASLVEALFILPIHMYDWGPKATVQYVVDENEDPFHHLQKGIFAPLWRIYHSVVRRFLDHKWLTFGGITALFLVAMTIFFLSVTGRVPLIKVKFFPGNYFRYHVTMKLPPGTAIERTDVVVRDLSRYIMSLGEKQAQSASGSAGFYEDEDYVRHMAANLGQIVVTLPEAEKRDFPENPTNDPLLHLAYIRKKLEAYVERTFPIAESRPVVKVFEENDGPPTGKAVNVRISGITTEVALNAADRLLHFLRNAPELADLRDAGDDRSAYVKTVKYTPKQEAVYEYGLTPRQVTALVAGALNGYPAGKFRVTDEEVDLMVRLARTDDKLNPDGVGLANPADILDLPVIEHSAAPVLLRDLVNLEYSYEPNSRARYKGRPAITLSADILEGSQLSAARVSLLINDYFEKHRREFPNVNLSFGGEFASTSKSYKSLMFAFLIAILGIYLVLASQFNDYFQPLIILSAVPFALIGVIMGLFISRTTFTIGSFMAIVGLAGVAVNDSLILIEFMNVRRKMGRSIRESVIEACAARLRPVLLTTITTILGLLPMAIGIPYKSISWAPMATAFVAGLSSSTILALLFVPVEYELFENLKAKVRKWVNRKKDSEKPLEC